jgi:hypothetical protein
VEGGLVLLPFSGWSQGLNSYTAAMQIFTFSSSSLTRRGLMMHGTPVRRSFGVATGLTGNLSEAELSLFDISDPTAPVEHGRVEPAPDYSDVLVFGDYAAQVKRRSDFYVASAENPTSLVDIVSRSEHADTAVALASVEIPVHAQLHRSGDLLVSVSVSVTDWSSYPYVYTLDIKVFDLSDPTVPVFAGELTTTRITPDGYYGWDDCWDCGGYSYGGGRSEVVAVPGGLAVLQRTRQTDKLGAEEICHTWPRDSYLCDDDGTSCTSIEGSIRCSSLDGAPEVCTGSFRRCTVTDDTWYCAGGRGRSAWMTTRCSCRRDASASTSWRSAPSICCLLLPQRARSFSWSRREPAIILCATPGSKWNQPEERP